MTKKEILYKYVVQLFTKGLRAQRDGSDSITWHGREIMLMYQFGDTRIIWVDGKAYCLSLDSELVELCKEGLFGDGLKLWAERKAKDTDDVMHAERRRKAREYMRSLWGDELIDKVWKLKSVHARRPEIAKLTRQYMQLPVLPELPEDGVRLGDFYQAITLAKILLGK